MKILRLVMISFAFFLLTGCVGMKSEYKPLYQAKPKIENLEKI